MINLFKVFIGDSVGDSVQEVLYSGYIGEGLIVKKFEESLSDLWGIERERIITLNSGTSALDLAMELCGIGDGDEVISTPVTCFATNVHLDHRRAKIIWADVDPITGLIDCKDVEKKISKRTKAIICVDYGGNPCDYNFLKKFSVPIIEDAAHAVLTNYKDNHIAKTGGDFVCFSFQAIKHLTCGDGGALVVPLDLSARAKKLKWYGFDRDKSDSFRCSQDVKESGFKYHMNNINASIGNENLKYVKNIVNKHKSNAKFFCDNIHNKKVVVPSYDENSSYWIFTLIVEDRDNFINYMKERGIESSLVHNRNDIYTIFKEFKDNSLNGVNLFSSRNVSIPVGWWVTEKEVNYIVNEINLW